MRASLGIIRSLIVILSAAVGGVACGPEVEPASESEGVGRDGQAIGSPDTVPTDIWNLNDLNTKPRNKPNGYFRLRAHIDLSSTAGWNGGKGWEPIHFTGTFDGNSFQIRNLPMNWPERWGAGFFSQLDRAIVRNLGLVNVNVKASALTGGLAGLISDSQITSSYVEGTVTGLSGAFGAAFEMGLFAGKISSSDVSRSYSRGTVTGSLTSAGGFAGVIDAGFGARSNVQECYSRTDVTPNWSASSVRAGGFASFVASSSVISIYAGGGAQNVVRGRGSVGGAIGELAGSVQLDYAYSRNRVTDWAVAFPNDKAGVYGVLDPNAEPWHLAGLLWDATVDPGNVSTGVGQAGLSTSVLKAPTSTSQYPYDNGTDADWSSIEWNAGTSSQYNVLRRVVRANEQLAE
jgi:hypothetical protein